MWCLFPLLVPLGHFTALCSPKEVLTTLGQRNYAPGGGLPQSARGQSLVVRAAHTSVGLTVLPVVRRNSEPGARTARGRRAGSPYLLRELGVEWWRSPRGGAVRIH